MVLQSQMCNQVQVWINEDQWKDGTVTATQGEEE